MSATTLLLVFAITVAVIALGMLAMAVGVIGSGRCLRGSCGGPEARDANGESLSCATCPNRERHHPHQPPYSQSKLRAIYSE